MESKIRCLIKDPGKLPRIAYIPNTLEALQEAVGGYIETVTLGPLVVICDEEGRLKRKKPNVSLCGVDFVGTVVLCEVDGEEFADLKPDIDELKQILPRSWWI